MRWLWTLYPDGLSIERKLIHTFTVTFGSPSTRVLSSVTTIAYFWNLLIWLHESRIRLFVLLICSVLRLWRCRRLRFDLLRKCLAVLPYINCHKGLVTCYVLSGFRNASLIMIHIVIQLSLLLSLSKYRILRILWENYEFPFILRDFRHIHQCVLRQLRTKSKTRAFIASCKFIECVVGEKFS